MNSRRLLPKQPLVDLQEEIYDDVRTWSREYLEVPNVHLNKLPACPFARQAWKDNKVVIEIRNPDAGYTRQLHRHVKNIDWSKKEILIFCDIHFKEYSLNKFQSIIDSFNNKYNKKDIYFLGFHPKNPATAEEQEFLVNPTGKPEELPSSNVEYSMMLIQKFSQLFHASDKLHRMGYYKKWPVEYYEDVVNSRQQLYKKLFIGGKNDEKR